MLKTSKLLSLVLVSLLAAGCNSAATLPSEELVAQPQQAVVVDAPEVLNFGSYFVSRSSASLQSLKQNSGALDFVVLDGGVLDSKECKLSVRNQQTLKDANEYLKKTPQIKKHFLVTNNFNGWQRSVVDACVKQKNFSSEILNYLSSNDYDGLSMDFESLGSEEMSDYVEIIKELKQKLQPQGLTVSVHVPAANQNWNYKGLSEAADQIILMGYDQNNSLTGPGPVSSAQWLRQVLGNLLAEVPKEKLVLGLGNFGYDWSDSGQVQSLSYNGAKSLSKKYNISLNPDSASKNNTFTYVDESGGNHTVWLLDSYSVGESVKVGKSLGINSFALYRFGSEDLSVWKNFHK
jgi:peptidoglycan-N-acetylglucosamine deacetylase